MPDAGNSRYLLVLEVLSVEDLASRTPVFSFARLRVVLFVEVAAGVAVVVLAARFVVAGLVVP